MDISKRVKINTLVSSLLSSLMLASSNLYAATQFLETFDNMPDWAPSSKNVATPYPPNWDFAYTEENWHPNDYPDSQPSMQINGNNPEQVYGGVGKSFINYVESYASFFSGDGIIIKDIEATNEVYVEFKVKFQPGFAADNEYGMLKLLRIVSYDGNDTSRIKFFENGNYSPIYAFNWVNSEWGVRHKHAFRCDAQEDNYYCNNPKILNPPREVVSGGMSGNFTSDVSGFSPQLEDLVNGGLLPSSGTVFHNQVYGDKWHKLAFYLKQNSSPGVQDGELKFWMDEQLLVDMNGIPWVGPNGSMDAKWNGVILGGNEAYAFNTDTNAPISARERWFAIDDLVISDQVPDVENAPITGTQFAESFDSQDDWQTGDKDNIYTLPNNWDYARTDETWHPVDHTDAQPSIKISGDTPEQVFGGNGKALVNYVESYNDTSNGGFTSDGVLSKDLTPTDELYVQFKLKFQPGFAANDEYGTLKLFQALSYDNEGPREKLNEQGHSAPVYYFEWVQSEWGLRHSHKFRCDAQSDNFYCTDPKIQNPPREINWGGMSTNYTSDISSLAPQIPDLVMGGNIPSTGTVYHNQVFGDQWHNLAFYLKQNSAPGVTDGTLKVWLDDNLIINMNEIAWIGNNGDMDSKWNNVTFGGMEKFHFNLDETAPISDRERWYSIDDIIILDHVPTDSSDINMELKCYWELIE